MQQQTIYLHTEKNIEQTEKILKSDGFEIVLKSDSVQLTISDLTKEELDCWKEFFGKKLNEFLKICDKQDDYIEKFRETRKQVNEKIKKFVDSFNENPQSFETSTIYEQIDKKLYQISRTTLYAGDFNDMTSLHYDVPEFRLISCSCIVAKKGSNVIRYLGFKAFPDPIITFSGPEAKKLKSSLEKMF